MGHPTAAELRETFEAPAPLTVGIEDEVLLLDPESLDLAPCAPDALSWTGGDPRFKLELPSSQLEIVTAPAASSADAIAALAAGRRDLEAAMDGRLRLAAAGMHPFAPLEGAINSGERYALTVRQYGPVALRQLVCGLQVHVAVRGPGAALHVYAGLRRLLPELAALGAAAPFAGGRDSGLASVRPLIAGLLPRQGVPPELPTWEAYAQELDWGRRSGAVPWPGRWWWELRPHVDHGTLEIRVPDAQATVADAEAVVAVVHALAARLAREHADGAPAPPAVPAWRLAENRWAACRDGVSGVLADPHTGDVRPTAELLYELIDGLAGDAAEVGATRGLQLARDLVAAGGGAGRQRAAARAGDGSGAAVARWLAGAFSEPRQSS